MVHSPSTVTLGPRDRAGIDAPGAIPRRWSHVARADKWAVALFVAIPLLMGIPPALVGRPLFPGSGTADNLTQNYPLRVLSGELLRHGHLPLWDPYIWSGDRKSTRLNSSHITISYAVFCLKKNKTRAVNVSAPKRSLRRTSAQSRKDIVGGPIRSARARARGCLFFFNDTTTTEIYTLSLHDALPS